MPILNLNWERDAVALRNLDTSFSTDYVYEMMDLTDTDEDEGISFGARFEAAPRSSPLDKAYAITLTRAEAESAMVALAGFTDNTLQEMVSVAVVRYETWNRRAVLADFYVHRPFRGKGLGRIMMKAVTTAVLKHQKKHLQHVRHLWLETQNVNYPAIRFYLSNGFRICGWDTSLYDEPHVDETAIFMVKELK